MTNLFMLFEEMFLLIFHIYYDIINYYSKQNDNFQMCMKFSHPLHELFSLIKYNFLTIKCYFPIQ